MTIATTDNQRQYNGNGVTTSFSFPLKFYADTDIKVTELDVASGVETVKTLTTHYTISGVFSDGAYQNGADIIAVAAPANGKRWTITRELDYKQETDYVENDDFPAASHENALDKLTMLIQDLKYKVGLAAKVPKSSTITDLSLGLPVANYILRWNSGATAIEAVDVVSASLTASLTPTLNNMIVGDGAAWVVNTPAQVRTALTLVVGTNVQAYDATLQSISATGTAADRMLYTTGVDTWAELTTTAYGRSVLNTADAAALRTLSGTVIGTNVQAYDATLTSIAATGTAADRMLYTTGVDTWAELVTTAYGRSVLNTADAAALRTLSGTVIGTNVQAFDATLTSIAATGTAADKMLYTTGVDTWAETAITAFGRTFVAVANAADGRTALALGDIATINLSGNAAQYLNGTGGWTVPAGSGDVVGPASSVQYRLAYWDDTSGNLLNQMSSSGTSGDYLKSQGAGSAPEWTTPGTAIGRNLDAGTEEGQILMWDASNSKYAPVIGGRELLGEVAAVAGVTEVEFTGLDTSGYTRFELEINNIKPATDGVNLYLTTKKVGGGSYESSNYKWVREGRDSNNTADVNGNNSAGQIALATPDVSNDTTDSGLTGVFQILNVDSTTDEDPSIQGFCNWNENSVSSFLKQAFVSGQSIAGAVEWTAIKLAWSSGSFHASYSGSIQLYGVKS